MAAVFDGASRANLPDSVSRDIGQDPFSPEHVMEVQRGRLRRYGSVGLFACGNPAFTATRNHVTFREFPTPYSGRNVMASAALLQQAKNEAWSDEQVGARELAGDTARY